MLHLDHLSGTLAAEVPGLSVECVDHPQTPFDTGLVLYQRMKNVVLGVLSPVLVQMGPGLPCLHLQKELMVFCCHALIFYLYLRCPISLYQKMPPKTRKKSHHD